MRLAPLVAIVSVAVIAVSSPPATTFAQTAPVDRPAEIRSGTCGSLGEVISSLAHVVLTSGDPQGQTSAMPVEQSGTVVPFTLDDVLSSNHAVIVQESPNEAAPIVACGDIGGALNPDGTLAVGMTSSNGSGLSGVAYFTPIEAFENMLVTILLVSEPSAAPTKDDESSAADGMEKSDGAIESPDPTDAPG